MAELVLNVHDTTGAVLNVLDGVAITHRVLRGPVEVAGGGAGSGDVVGPSSVTADRPAVFDGTTGKLLKAGSATGAALVSAADAAAARTALGLGTAATSATGDFASPASVTAAVTPVTPVTVNVRLACSAVDGSATTFEVVVPQRGASASGVVPAGWVSVFTIPDVATLEGFLGGLEITTARFLVVSEPGVFEVDSDSLTGAWTDITPADGVEVLLATDPAPRYWFSGGTLRYLTVSDLVGGITSDDVTLDAADITKTGAAGLDTGQTTVDGVLENHEGILDSERFVGAYFDTTVIDPTDYDTAPVTQPTPDGGTIVLGADVLVLTAVDTTKRGIWHVDPDDGTWSQLEYPDILIGNSFMAMVNAEGTPGDGTHFEWLDEDPTIPKRKSGEYPGSSQPPDGETWADGRNGRWIKYTPGGDTPVVGGQDEGPVVTATTATTLLDAAIPVTGAAGDHFTITIGGRFNNQSGTTKRPTITVRLGSTDVLTLTPASAISSNASDRLFRINIDMRVNGATDVNVTADGQIITSVFGVSAGTASEDIGAGVNLDVLGQVESGGSQEVQLTQVTVVRLRA